MLPLFEMMMRAQNGMAMDAMAKQFGLAQDKAAQAMAALMPAFSSGLKRNASNPYDMSALFSSMSSGNYAKYFEDMGKAFTPQGVADGNSALEQLFGSKEVSRAVAAQAAQLTGIGQDILKQMLPAMADTIMGGLFKQGMGQMQEASNPFANSPMASMMQQWLESTGFAPKPAPKEASLFDNPFANAFRDMMGGAQAAKPAAGANPFMDNPFAKAFQDMMGGNFGQGAAAQPAPAPKGTAKSAGETEPAQAMVSMFNSMFDSGLEVQKNYQKSMEQIFETYMTKAQSKDAPEPPPEDAKA